MKAMLPYLGSALVALLAASAAGAQCPPGCGIPRAPDTSGPGYYAPNEYGLWYGPNYELYPPFGPFNGVPVQLGPRGAPPSPPAAAAAPGYPYGAYGPRPPYPVTAGGGPRMVPYAGGPYGGAGGDGGQIVPPPASFPTHPFARSPRDFFMEDAPDYYGVNAPSPRPYVPTPPFPAALTPRSEYPR